MGRQGVRVLLPCQGTDAGPTIGSSIFQSSTASNAIHPIFTNSRGLLLRRWNSDFLSAFSSDLTSLTSRTNYQIPASKFTTWATWKQDQDLARGLFRRFVLKLLVTASISPPRPNQLTERMEPSSVCF